MEALSTYLESRYSPKSYRGYLNIIQRYVTYMGAHAIEATYGEVVTYIGNLRRQGMHPKSLKHQLFCIKIYYQWLYETSQRRDHPCKSLLLKDKINKKIQLQELYTRDRLVELLKKHQSSLAIVQQRDEIMISLLIYQAMSVQEIKSLDISDVNLKEAKIKAKGGYLQNARTLHLHASQIILLQEYMSKDRDKLLAKARNVSETDKEALLLTKNGKRIFEPLIARVINEGKSKDDKLLPMRIRQSVIMHLLKEGHDLRVVQEFAGHKRASSTEEYKQTELDELRTQIEKYHPLG